MAKCDLILIAIAALLINVAPHVHCSDDNDEFYSEDEDYKNEDDDDYEYEYDELEDDDDTDGTDDDSPSLKRENPKPTEEPKSTESNCHSTESPKPECSNSHPACEEYSPSNPNPDQRSSFCVFDLLNGKPLFNYETMSDEMFSDKQKARDERNLPRLIRFNIDKDTCLNMNNRQRVFGWLKDICAED